MTQFLHIITKLTTFSASRISDRQVSHLVQQIMRFLQLKYGSLMKAALGSSQDLNNVIGKLLYDTLFGRAMRPEMARDLEALIDQVPMLVRKSPFLFHSVRAFDFKMTSCSCFLKDKFMRVSSGFLGWGFGISLFSRFLFYVTFSALHWGDIKSEF